MFQRGPASWYNHSTDAVLLYSTNTPARDLTILPLLRRQGLAYITGDYTIAAFLFNLGADVLRQNSDFFIKPSMVSSALLWTSSSP